MTAIKGIHSGTILAAGIVAPGLVEPRAGADTPRLSCLSHRGQTHAKRPQCGGGLPSLKENASHRTDPSLRRAT
jgi:hypothetical protein